MYASTVTEKERMQEPCVNCGVVLESHYEPLEVGKMWIPCGELAERQAKFSKAFGIE